MTINDKIKKVKDLREKYSISQRQLGLMLNYSRDYIYRVEAGKRRITAYFDSAIDNLNKLLENGLTEIPK
jgi:transcriptional regulator with XRE-family HTH domain